MYFGKKAFQFSIFIGASLYLTELQAAADVFGRLRIVVKNVDNDKPVSDAKVVLHDTKNVHPDITLVTGADGTVTSPLLETRAWAIRTTKEGFDTDSAQATVGADTTGTVRVSLEPTETTIKVTGTKNIIKPDSPSQVTSRDQQFLSQFPLSSANPQQLSGVLLTTPGMVQNSTNQVHPRGEHSATSVYVQGVQLGGVNQGRFGPTIDPRALENVDVATGSYAPEYGSQSGAVLNTTIRSGTLKPQQTVEIGGGNYGTLDSFFSTSGQTGAPIGAPDAEGNQQKSIGYYIAGSYRQTDNALEPPQPRNQTAHNGGESGTLLGRFDFRVTKDDTLTLLLSAAPARTDVANRTGLPAKYADYGQGYGFGGALSETEAAARGILSQDAEGQDIYQEDLNNFGILQWRHAYNDKVSSLFSFGGSQSYLDVKNNNPDSGFGPLPEDRSIEYDPTVKRHANHILGSASVTAEVGNHTLKAGGSVDFQNSDDSYQLVPGSQLALNALHAADPRLAPPGALQFDGQGEPVVDSQGNQVYLSDTGRAAPKLSVHSSGYYHAAYVQDTWRATEKLTANYGVRFDTYRQDQNLDEPSVNKVQFSPRLNLAYALFSTTVLRASYNRLFLDPPLSQGSVIGNPISPERVHQYDLSIEQQITPRQRAKVAYYDKQIKNQVDTGLLIPTTQLGIFTSVNLERSHVHGVELSYDILPSDTGGTSAFAAYTYSKAEPSGVDNTGEPVDAFNDHDQRHTMVGGLAYTFENGMSVGATEYYGSGVTSSALEEDAPRKSRFLTNLTASTGPKFLWDKGGLKLSVQNLFDDRERINFGSAFSGTRFQQGRTILVSAFATF